MKSDEDVKMISAEAPVLFAKACEMFILELTLRSWIHTEDNKRKTLQKNDIAMAVSKTDTFDFLIDIVPREDAIKDENLGQRPQNLGLPPELQNFYFLSQQQQVLQQQQQQQQQQHHQQQQQPPPQQSQPSQSSQSGQQPPQHHQPQESVLENRPSSVMNPLLVYQQQQVQQQQQQQFRYQAQLMQQMQLHQATGGLQGQTSESQHQEESAETSRDDSQHF